MPSQQIPALCISSVMTQPCASQGIVAQPCACQTITSQPCACEWDDPTASVPFIGLPTGDNCHTMLIMHMPGYNLTLHAQAAQQLVVKLRREQ